MATRGAVARLITLPLLPGLRRFTQLLELVLDQEPEQGAIAERGGAVLIMRIDAVRFEQHMQAVDVRLLTSSVVQILLHHLLRVYDARPR